MAFGLGKKKRSLEDDVRKLTRAELLEMLIEQTRLADRLREKNKQLTEELAICKEDLERAASLELIMSRLERIEAIAALRSGVTREEIARINAQVMARQRADREAAARKKEGETSPEQKTDGINAAEQTTDKKAVPEQTGEEKTALEQTAREQETADQTASGEA